MRYRFDHCVLDTDAVQLVVGGEPVGIEPQVFDVLRLLIDERHRVLPKTELLDRVWGHTFVTESALTSRIKSARAAIGDNGREQRLIRTVHGRGYQFVGEVTEERGASPTGRSWTTQPLPLPASELVGRAADLEQVEALLDRAGLVTLVGPGGVGKTRLAIESARRWTQGGVAFVDLTRVRRPSEVMQEIAGSLGLRVDGPDRAVATICDLLAGHRLLLVLDNVEHVVDAATEITELTRTLGELTVLATSRERLRVDGERVHLVDPLATSRSLSDEPDARPAAVELFERLARSVDPGIDVERYRADIDRICVAVDGLPLAIELVAGQIGTLPPDMLAARLRERMRSTSTARRDLPERHRTMDDTIDWSLQLLDRDQLALFTRLGVFATDASLDAIEEVCRDERLADPLEVLPRLVDTSLVRRRFGTDGTPRFGMLELLRARAGELLAADDEAAPIRRRHADVVARCVEEIDDRRWDDLLATWVDRLAELLPEVRRSFDWAAGNGEWETAGRLAGSLGAFWHREGGRAEAHRLLDLVGAHTDALTEPTRARVLLASGLVGWHDGDLAAAHTALARAGELFGRTGDDARRTLARAFLALSTLDDPDRSRWATAELDHAVESARTASRPGLLVEVLNARGEYARTAGDDEAARRSYEEAATRAEEIGDRTMHSVALANLSYLACHDGRFDEARDIARKALRLCAAEGRRLMAAWSVHELAGPASGLGEHELAARLLGASGHAMTNLGSDRPPSDRIEDERVVAEVIEALGKERYRELATAGATLSLDQAIALALGDEPTPHILLR